MLRELRRLILSQTEFLDGQGTCWRVDLTSPFCSRMFISVTFMFLEMTVIIISITFRHQIVQKFWSLIPNRTHEDLTWCLNLVKVDTRMYPIPTLSYMIFKLIPFIFLLGTDWNFILGPSLLTDS